MVLQQFVSPVAHVQSRSRVVSEDGTSLCCNTQWYLQVQWRQKEVSNSNTSCFVHIPHVIFTLAHKLSMCSASWGEAALIPYLHTKSYLLKPKDMAKASACLLLVPAKQEKTTGSDLDGIF